MASHTPLTTKQATVPPMCGSRSWLIVSMSGLFLFWVYVYFLKLPLPFFGYFSDPEMAYIFSSAQLAEFGFVEKVDHPGAFLQIFGVGISWISGYEFTDAFNLSALEQFRGLWLFWSVCIGLLTLLCLYRLSGGRAGVYLGAVCLLLHDYNNLTYFGRFSPEGAFFALYWPLLMLCLWWMRRGVDSLTWGAVLWGGLLLGATTTIKLTLWPVTAFVIGAFYCLGGELSSSKHRLKAMSMLLMAILAYGIVGSIFAEDLQSQMEWFTRLMVESGRYGHAGETGSFLPITQIVSYTLGGLSLQSYTTLVPMCLLCLFALIDLGAPGSSTRVRLLSGGFLLCFLLTWVIYAKHPYQIKYLLPQSYLFVSYFLLRVSLGSMAPVKERTLRYFVPLMAAVLFNACINYHVLHRLSESRYTQILEVADRLVSELHPSHIYISSEVPHPYTTFGRAVGEISDLRPQFAEKFEQVTSFSERDQAHGMVSNTAFPMKQIDGDALILSTRYFTDTRVTLYWYDELLELFAYRTKSHHPEPSL